MKEKSFNTLKNEYIFFKNRLDENIRNCQISRNLQPSEDCYLIEESYLKQLEESFIDFSSPDTPKNHYKTIDSETMVPLPIREPKIINDFKTAINYIDNNKKIALISKKIIQLIDFKNKLIENKCVVYYGGNRKLIIEFKDSNEKKSFLLINPLRKISFNQNIFIIINNQQKLLYIDILSDEDNSSIETMTEQNSLIVSYENYVNNNYRSLTFYHNYMNSYSFPLSNPNNSSRNNSHNLTNFPFRHDNTSLFSKHKKLTSNDISNISSNNTFDKTISQRHKVIINVQDQLPFKKELLNIFINIFYYEKLLSENKESLFNDKRKYCLINPQWLNNLKNYYNYEKLCSLLNKNCKENPDVNYKNIDDYIDDIIKANLNKNTLNFNRKQLSEELTDIKNITCFLLKKFGIKFIFEGVIFPVKIMKLIKEWNKKIPIFPKELHFKNNFIIYVNNPKIIIGNLNDDNIFTPKYVFEYNSSYIVSKERKTILNSKTIKEYIKSKKCSLYDFKLQKLKNEKDEDIGKFIIMKTQNHKIIKNTKPSKLRILTPSEIKNLRARTIDHPSYTKSRILEYKNKKDKGKIISEENEKIQININKKIFPKSKMVKAPPFCNSARINGKKYQSHLVNKNLSELQTSIRKNKGDNDESIKALIEKLMKNNQDLQEKLESKVNEVNKKNEMIEKLKDENEKFKKGLSNSENRIGMRMNHVLNNDY